MTEWFRVNVDENEVEVVHNDPPTPKCDVKHMLEDVSINLASVERLIADGQARWCKHCFPER